MTPGNKDPKESQIEKTDYGVAEFERRDTSYDGS